MQIFLSFWCCIRFRLRVYKNTEKKNTRVYEMPKVSKASKHFQMLRGLELNPGATAGFVAERSDSKPPRGRAPWQGQWGQVGRVTDNDSSHDGSQSCAF